MNCRNGKRQLEFNAVLSQCNSPINAFRASAEKANFVANFLPQMDRFHFKINAEIIEVATRNYSFLFFPELTHMDYPHYISECEDFYMTVLSYIISQEKGKHSGYWLWSV